MLACSDYGDRLYGPDYVSVRNNHMSVVDDAFSILFLCECILKTVAMGFVLHKNSYMRDRWNWLDIFVVTVSVVLWLPMLNGNKSVKILRIFRILRPLRSIKQLPTMKKLVKTLIACVFGLFNVIFFMLFVFTMFAIFGSHQFSGD
jgi:Ion transport protein